MAVDEAAELGAGAELAEGAPVNSDDGAMRAGANCERDQGAHSPPKWGTRADSPGPRGCWALTKAGRHCAAAVRSDGDYCNAHSGIGVAAAPAEHAPIGAARAAEVRRARADLRLVIGNTRMDTPRAALRALAIVNAERLAGSTIAACFDPEVPAERRARLALDVIEAADPKVSAVATVTGELDVGQASLSQLLELASERGISLERPAPTPAQLPESA